MEQLLLNLYNDISALSFIDILFLVLFIVLVILVISLISFLKNSNKKIKQDAVEIPKIDEEPIKVEISKENIEEKTNSDELDLTSITKELENIRETNVNLTPYEKEQEEKAIISYDELLKTRSDLKINYQEEENLDDVVVKKVDMENMTSELDMSEVREIIKDKETNKTPVVISYEKEEAFLESLKKLQQMLNS